MLLAFRRLVAVRLLDKTQDEKGFTLIELIMVIVILGILSAVAIPKFVDLSVSAEQAAGEGVAGGLGAASSINKAGCMSVSPLYTPTANICVAITDCSAAGSLLDGGMPTNYAVTAGAVGQGGTTTCTITKTGVTFTTTPTFILHGT